VRVLVDVPVGESVLKSWSVCSPCSKLQGCVVVVDLVVLESPQVGKSFVVLVDVDVHDSVVVLFSSET